MRVVREIVVLPPLEDARQVAAVQLTGGLDEGGRIREDFRDGDAVAVELLVAEEVVDDERLVDPRAHVRVPRVGLAEERLELAGLRGEVERQRDELRVALLDVDALGGEGEEEIRFRVGIDEGLERHFGLVELEG